MTSETIPINTDGSVQLPTVDVLTGRGFITGKSGSGKSNTASVIAEELLERGFPLLIVDTDGEYWGLKETYELLHVGADEECDLQVGPEHAGKIAELTLEQNVPIILDVSGYLDTEVASELIRKTASELFTREKKLNKPFLLLVEEIHEYIPEGGGLDETGEMLIRVAKRGRKRGLGLCGMSQRPANVKKDFITQCDWLMWHRLTWQNDTKVVRQVVGNGYDETVQELNDGEGLLLADFLEKDVTRVQVRRKETFDAGATPDLGEFQRPELKSIDTDLVGELEAISQREDRRKDRIEELEQLVEEKEERIRELEEELENARDLTNMAEQFTQAMLQSGGENEAGEKVTELVEERNRLENGLEQREERISELEGRVNELEAVEEELEQYESLNISEASEAVTRLQEALGVSSDGETKRLRQKLESARQRINELEQSEPEPPETDILDHPAVQRQVKNLKKIIGGIGEKQLKMLEWYKYYGPSDVGDAYFHAGYKRSSGRKHEANKPLRDAGLIEKVGKGEYEYVLDEWVRSEFEENPQITEEDMAVLVNEVESVFEERLEAVES